jgi:hypothetical protein
VNLRPEEINCLIYGSADQRTGNVVIELKAGIISHLSIKVSRVKTNFLILAEHVEVLIESNRGDSR